MADAIKISSFERKPMARYSVGTGLPGGSWLESCLWMRGEGGRSLTDSCLAISSREGTCGKATSQPAATRERKTSEMISARSEVFGQRADTATSPLSNSKMPAPHTAVPGFTRRLSKTNPNKAESSIA
jgi:hypothetical protein